MVNKFLNPKNDYAFKQIFGQERSKPILIDMLNAVLKSQIHKPIVDLSFLSPFQEPEVLARKQSIVDVLCKDQDGCQYIIEMQMANSDGFEERAQYYATKAFVSQMGKGEKYEGLKEVIFLAFTDFDIFPEEPYKNEHVTVSRHTGKRYLDKLSFTFVNLPKFEQEIKGRDILSLSLEEKFYYFLAKADEISQEDYKVLIRKGEPLKKAFAILERIAMNDEEKMRYEEEDKRLRDWEAQRSFSFKEGMEKGKKEGIEKGRKEERDIIKHRLLATGMSREEVEKLIPPLGV